jgi:hypothetical protein
MKKKTKEAVRNAKGVEERVTKSPSASSTKALM